MTTVTVSAHSIRDDAALRQALVACSVAHRQGVPSSITSTDSEGMAFVGLNGPEAWRMKTVGLPADQAARVAAALAGHGDHAVIAPHAVIQDAIDALRGHSPSGMATVEPDEMAERLEQYLDAAGGRHG